MYYFTGKNPQLKKLGYSIFRKDCLSYARKFEDTHGKHELHMYVAGGMGLQFCSIEYQYTDIIIEFVLLNKDKGSNFWGTQDENKAYHECNFILTKDNEVINRSELYEKAKKDLQESYPNKTFAPDVLDDFIPMMEDRIIAIRFLPHLVQNILELNKISPLRKG